MNKKHYSFFLKKKENTPKNGYEIPNFFMYIKVGSVTHLDVLPMFLPVRPGVQTETHSGITYSI
jgi:hypothetical protein